MQRLTVATADVLENQQWEHLSLLVHQCDDNRVCDFYPNLCQSHRHSSAAWNAVNIQFRSKIIFSNHLMFFTKLMNFRKSSVQTHRIKETFVVMRPRYCWEFHFRYCVRVVFTCFGVANFDVHPIRTGFAKCIGH